MSALSDPPRSYLAFRIKQLDHRLTILFESVLRSAGNPDWSYASMAVLTILLSQGPHSGAALARVAMVSPQAMNISLRRLEALRLVARKADAMDARQDQWRITRRGKSQLGEAQELLLPKIERLHTAFSEKELSRFSEFLERATLVVAAMEDGGMLTASSARRPCP